MFVPAPDHVVPLTLIPGVCYGEGQGTPLLLDMVCSQDRPPTAGPAVVWLHGGGWFGGSRVEEVSYWCALFAAHGFLAVSVDYRLSGDACFPAQIHDVKAAIRWLRATAGQYQVDPDRIGIAGFSAGGHLAALAGLTSDRPELEGHGGSAGYSSRVQAVAVASAPSDFLRTGGAMINDAPSPVTKLFGGTVAEYQDLMQLASPVAHVTPAAPPFLIAHGTLDETVPFEQAEQLHTALATAGCAVEFIVREGAYHNWNARPDPTFPSVRYWEFGPLALAFMQKHLVDLHPRP